MPGVPDSQTIHKTGRHNKARKNLKPKFTKQKKGSSKK